MRAALRISSELLEQLSGQPRFAAVEERTMPLFDLSAKLLTILFGSYALLLIWGINPVGWLASAGIVGIAVGFAAKDTLANLFSGFFIVADAPYKIGDYITSHNLCVLTPEFPLPSPLSPRSWKIRSFSLHPSGRPVV